MRYWLFVLAGLIIAGAGVVGMDWGIWHLVRTGNCGTSPTYISYRPCPPGTGGHILALTGGIFAGLIGIGLWAARGSSGRPSRVGLGLIMWSLLFVTLAASVAYAAFGPANNNSSGARTTAIVLAAIFVPMGLAPLPFAFGASRRQVRTVRLVQTPRFRPAAAAPPPPNPAHRVPEPAADDEDPLAKIAKLGELRDRGLVTPEEFEAQKKRLLDEV